MSMNKKKKLPLTVLKSLESFVNLSGSTFKVIDPKENLVHILDIDNTSDFYFKIEKYEKKNNGTFHLLLSRKPTNENENGGFRAWIDIKQLEPQFNHWLKLLEQYENIESFYDDPIVKSNAEKFFQRFEIVDDNADIESFDLEQQLFLEEYLNNSKRKLNNLKKKQTPEKIIEIDALVKDTEDIKNALTTETKKKIMLRLSRFWGKAQKAGLEIIKEVFVNLTAEVLKKLMLNQ